MRLNNLKTHKTDLQDYDFKEVVSFLGTTRAFDDEIQAVEVMSTHSSLVFLGKCHVYKIKRPVKYAYMDFTSLEKRKANCEREYELNKSISPELYLDVVTITRERDGTLAINGDGRPIEWAVKMKRFPQEDILYNIACELKLSDQLALQLGENIALYHRELECIPDHNSVLQIKKVLDQVEQFFTTSEHEIEPPLFTKSMDQLNTLFLKVKNDLEERAKAGSVRRCHGDLHLKNIVLVNEVPTLFDALEFDECLATIDVIYDLSFLLMDLLFLGLKPQANILLNRYLQKSWALVGKNGLRILPFCLGLRAVIRAMVACQMAQTNPATKQEKQAEAKLYLKLTSAVLKKTKPVLIAIGGLSGTGKSTFAKTLSPQLADPVGAVLLRSDLERKQMLGVSEFEHLGSDHYTSEMSAKVYEQLFEKASQILSAGQTVVIDAVFLDKEMRQTAIAIAEKQNVPFCGLFLDAPLSVLLKRVAARKNDASDADTDVVKKQYARQQQEMTFKDYGWASLDASCSKLQTLNLGIATLKQEQLL